MTTAIDGLIPAIIQCFGVILIGYLAGRWKFLSDAQAQGLNAYVTKFALPCVFFRVMVSINFNDVSWFLIGAISLSKLIAFSSVFVGTLLLDRQSPYGSAAILAMFSSQSNDVALGYPVLKALYPDLASYIYLFAPTQLVLLNPFAYLFLEWHQLRRNTLAIQNSSDAESSKCAICFRQCLLVFWRVLSNPLFFMTVIGVIFNFILKHTIPVYVDGLLQIIAESFSATALFSLGFGMVGKMAYIKQREFFILVAVLLIKLVFLPFVTREMVVHLIPDSQSNNSLAYSTFGFLYGAVPTAPPVYLFAAQYDVLPAVAGVGLVLGTFLCAPIMFILAHVVTIYSAEPSDYDRLLNSTVTSVSWISLGGCLWTMVILFLTRKAFRIPHRFTICYLLCVLLSSLGVGVGHALKTAQLTDQQMSWNDHVIQPATFPHYIQFVVFFIGCTGARIWAVLIAVALFLQRFRGVCFLLHRQCWFYLVGFVCPVLVTSFLLIFSNRQRIRDLDPVFQYGRAQLIVSLVVLFVCALSTLLLTFCYIRLGSSYPDQTQQYSPDSTQSVEDHFPQSIEQHEQVGESLLSSSSTSDSICRCGHGDARHPCHRLLVRYERLCRAPFNTCRVPSTMSLSHQSSSYQTPFNLPDSQHHRHTTLLLFILTTMFFGICLCTWRLVREAPSGIYLVLEFLDGVFNFGQGIALFVLFGLDADLIIFPLKRIINRCRCGLYNCFTAHPIHANQEVLPVSSTAELNPRSKQFLHYHSRSFLSTHGKRLSIPTEDGSIKIFLPDSLKRWLLDAGLVQSNAEAVRYTDQLKSDQVIQPRRGAPSNEITYFIPSYMTSFFPESD